MIKKPTMIVRAGEIERIIDWLSVLARIYEALGIIEEAAAIELEIELLKRRFYLPKDVK